MRARSMVAAATVVAVVGLGLGMATFAQAAETAPPPQTAPPTTTSTCVAPPVSGSVVGQAPTSLTFSLSVSLTCGGFHAAQVAVYGSFNDAQMSTNQRGSAIAFTVESAAALTVTGLSPGTPYWYRFSGGGSSFYSLVQGPAFTLAAPTCDATYLLDGEWDGGFVARINVRNATSGPVSGWRVSWAWPGQQSVTSIWSATVVANGATVVLTNADYNGTLAAGQTATLGFLATGPRPAPTTVQLTCSATRAG